MFFHLKRLVILALWTIVPQAIYAFDSCDLDSIRQVMKSWKDEWNINHGENYRALYTEKADFVNIFGIHFFGNDEIECRHVHILRTFLKNSWFEIEDLKVREVQPELAIAHVVWHVTMGSQNDDLKVQTLQGIFTHVLVKENSNWKITASQNTLIREDQH